MPDGGHHFGVGEFPEFRSLGGFGNRFQQCPQLARTDQHPLPIRLLFQRQHIILDTLESDGGDRGGHVVPGDLRFDDFEQFI